MTRDVTDSEAKAPIIVPVPKSWNKGYHAYCTVVAVSVYVDVVDDDLNMSINQYLLYLLFFLMVLKMLKRFFCV